MSHERCDNDRQVDEMSHERCDNDRQVDELRGEADQIEQKVCYFSELVSDVNLLLDGG
jgi:hypothetical protein